MRIDSGERWRRAPVLDGRYFVSDHGHVWREEVVFRDRRGQRKKLAAKSMKPDIDKDGYHVFRFRVGEKREAWKCHQLVMAAFCGPCPEGMCVAHNDGDRANNHISNLRYDTMKGNHADKALHGTLAIGERHGKSKLTEDQVREILGRKGEHPAKEVGREFGISATHVHRLWRREFWLSVAA